MRIASVLVGLALVAEAACTRPTPGYCGDDRGVADNGKCGTGLTCNRDTLLCDRPDAAVVVVDGGADADAAGDARPADVAEAGADGPAFTTCGDGGTCATGTCIDGVCCQSSTCRRCESCAVPGVEGICTVLPALTDDLDSCIGDRTCDGFGGCLLKVGKSCGNATDCASSACVDGVCCASACTDTCFTCNQTASPGTCLPMIGAEDPNATVPCSTTGTCVASSGGTPVCKLKNGEPCTEAADCANGTCSPSYRDADMDGFGALTPTLFCGTVPPAGYLTTSGDCCDIDSNARPNQVQFSAVGTTCGNFDRNCDNRDERENPLVSCGCVTSSSGTTCGRCI